MYVFIMYIMCLVIFEGKTEVQDEYPMSLNPVQKANDPIQGRNRSIGQMLDLLSLFLIIKYFLTQLFCFNCSKILKVKVF